MFSITRTILAFSATTMLAATPIAAQSQNQNRQSVVATNAPIGASNAQRVSSKIKDKDKSSVEAGSGLVPVLVAGIAALVIVGAIFLFDDDNPTSP